MFLAQMLSEVGQLYKNVGLCVTVCVFHEHLVLHGIIQIRYVRRRFLLIYCQHLFHLLGGQVAPVIWIPCMI